MERHVYVKHRSSIKAYAFFQSSSWTESSVPVEVERSARKFKLDPESDQDILQNLKKWNSLMNFFNFRNVLVTIGQKIGI